MLGKAAVERLVDGEVIRKADFNSVAVHSAFGTLLELSEKLTAAADDFGLREVARLCGARR